VSQESARNAASRKAWKEETMRAVIQRVNRAAVQVEGAVVGQIKAGLFVLLGITQEDGEAEAAALARKVAGLRIFGDADGKMNLSVVDTGGQMLVVSQFTLYGDVRKGRRPSFVRAARPEHAEPLYMHFCALLREEGITVATGTFGAHMEIELVNDGPVTLLLDSADLGVAP
jgi:D-tyrosyl-tRNA(Tyr) deacylase